MGRDDPWMVSNRKISDTGKDCDLRIQISERKMMFCCWVSVQGALRIVVAHPPIRRKQASPWTNRPIVVFEVPGGTKAKGSQKWNERERGGG